MQVIGQYNHHARCRHADEVGELADVKTPGNIPAQARYFEALEELDHVEQKPDSYDAEQKNNPSPIPIASF
jgi:hypothetical protein